MVITESILASSQISNLLESIEYLTEEESRYTAAEVPVRENERFGYTIALEDINNFCESNGVDDMGYAVKQICNASGIDPYNIAFSINEENLIDKETTEFVLDIIQEGLPVFVSPLSKNCIEYIMADEAVDYFMHTGDEFLLEALVNDDIEAFVESRDQRNGNRRKAQRVSGFKNHKHEWEDEEDLSVKQRRKQEKRKGNKKSKQSTNADPTPEPTQQSVPPKPPTPEPQQKNTSTNQNKQQNSTNTNSNTKDQSQTSTSQQTVEDEKDIPNPKDSTQNKFFKAAQNAVKKGKSHIEKLIIALRKKLEEWEQAGQAANAGYLTKLRGYVSRIIGYLVKKVVEFTAH